MAKVIKKEQTRKKQISVEYYNLVGQQVQATLTGWSDGEGVDIDLDGTVIELSNFELYAVVALAGLESIRPL